jgi:hypothetical protein
MRKAAVRICLRIRISPDVFEVHGRPISLLGTAESSVETPFQASRFGVSELDCGVQVQMPSRGSGMRAVFRESTGIDGFSASIRPG